DVAQPRDVGHRGGDVGEPGDGGRDRPALAHPGDRDAGRVDAGQGADGLDRAHTVGEDAPVVVVVRVLDAAGEGARGGDAGPDGVGCGAVAVGGRGALPAGVHDDGGVARCG